MFTTQDRVRLWNRLVFTNGYFKSMANSKYFKRGDLKTYYKLHVEDNVQIDEQNLLKEKRADLEATLKNELDDTIAN